MVRGRNDLEVMISSLGLQQGLNKGPINRLIRHKIN